MPTDIDAIVAQIPTQGLENVYTLIVKNIGVPLALFFAWSLMYIGCYAINRRRKLHFFSIDHRNTSFKCYLSRMMVTGTKARPGVEMKTGYTGNALLMPEVVGARTLFKHFRGENILVPIAISKWISKKGFTPFVLFGAIESDLDISPTDEELAIIPTGTFVSLGSHIYNGLSAIYLDKCIHVEFAQDEDKVRKIIVKTGAFGGQQIRADGQDVGVLIRVNDQDPKSGRNRTAFICCGIGASATYACSLYLASNWNNLLDDCGTHDFVGILRLPGQVDRETFNINLDSSQFQLISFTRPQTGLITRISSAIASKFGKD